jgi:drug/metabolite transporter (DMT)-like permease
VPIGDARDPCRLGMLVTRADWLRLILLAAIWGSSFILYRIVTPVLGAVWTAESRVSLAGVALLAFAFATKAKLEPERWRWYGLVGVLNSGIPFALIAFAQLKLTASMAAILNATTPMWSVLLGALFFGGAFTLYKGLGLLLGVVGVAVLVGWSPLEPSLQTTLSIAAMIGATFCYGLSSNMANRFLKGAPPLGAAVGSQLGSSLALALLLPFDLPRATPSLLVLACVVMLALVCSALAYILYFRLILDVGAVQASTVTLLVPIFSMVWAALFLGEIPTLVKILACGIIVSGVLLINREAKKAI